jgi:hypothetical protein
MTEERDPQTGATAGQEEADLQNGIRSMSRPGHQHKR